MSVVKVIVCDECHDIYDPLPLRVTRIREEAQKAGWRYIGGKDYCYACCDDKPWLAWLATSPDSPDGE